MSGGDGKTQAGGPAPTPLLSAENRVFGSLPWPNVNAATGNAFSGIQGLDTNPAARYGQAANVGQQFTGIGGSLAGQAQGQLNQFSPFVSQALQTGFDPQRALYARQFQQQQDQTRAALAANGVGATPYGAGIEAQANNNFNLDWQNQMLQRQQTGAQTAEGLAGAGVGNAASLLGAGTSAAQAGLGLGQSVDTQQFNAQQQAIQDFIQYALGNTANSQAFTGAANNTYGAGVNAAGISNQAAQQSNQSLLGSLGGLGSLAGSALAFL